MFLQFSPDLLYAIRKLIEEEGAVKVRSIIQATSLPQHILDLTHQYAALGAAIKRALGGNEQLAHQFWVLVRGVGDGTGRIGNQAALDQAKGMLRAAFRAGGG